MIGFRNYYIWELKGCPQNIQESHPFLVDSFQNRLCHHTATWHSTDLKQFLTFLIMPVDRQDLLYHFPSIPPSIPPISAATVCWDLLPRDGCGSHAHPDDPESCEHPGIWAGVSSAQTTGPQCGRRKVFKKQGWFKCYYRRREETLDTKTAAMTTGWVDIQI